MKKYDVAVIGGCASGMVAAINDKRKNPKLNISIIEKLPFKTDENIITHN